jgi:hypothetical protein
MPRNRLLLVTLGVLAALLAVALFLYVRAHRRQVLVVTADTLVLRDFPTGPSGVAAPNPVVTLITPGGQYPVLDIRQREDVEAVRILLAPNITGWVITGPAAHVERSH